jgi:DNA-binding MarR family transcriptional regulator
MSSDVSKVLDDLRRIVRVLRRSSRAAERTVGLNGAQLFVMQVLAAHPKLSLNQLATRTRTHQSTVSVVVSRLVRRGLVARTRSQTDGRSVLLALTAAGQRLLSRAPEAAQEHLIDGIERLHPRTRTQLAGALRKLVDAMHIGSDDPGMFFGEEPPTRQRKSG